MHQRLIGLGKAVPRLHGLVSNAKHDATLASQLGKGLGGDQNGVAQAVGDAPAHAAQAHGPVREETGFGAGVAQHLDVGVALIASNLVPHLHQTVGRTLQPLQKVAIGVHQQAGNVGFAVALLGGLHQRLQSCIVKRHDRTAAVEHGAQRCWLSPTQ